MSWTRFQPVNTVDVTCVESVRSCGSKRSQTWQWQSLLALVTLSLWLNKQTGTVMFDLLKCRALSFVTDLRKQARQLENELDLKLVSFSKLCTSYSSSRDGGRRDTYVFCHTCRIRTPLMSKDLQTDLQSKEMVKWRLLYYMHQVMEPLPDLHMHEGRQKHVTW